LFIVLLKQAVIMPKKHLYFDMDVRRLPDLGEKDFQRLRKYLHAWRFLQGLEPDTTLIEE
jgi:hypothetical protein